MNAIKSQRRWLIWLPLLAVAAWLAFFGDKTPTGKTESVNAVIPTSRTTTTAPSQNVRSDSGTNAATPATLEALLARDLLYPRVKSNSAGTDLFASGSWTPPPPPRIAPPVLPPPAPTAPALPFTYIGKKLEGGSWEVYVARGEQSFVLRPGSMIESTYRVHSIVPPSLSLIYLPLGQTQTLAIGESQ